MEQKRNKVKKKKQVPGNCLNCKHAILKSGTYYCIPKSCTIITFDIKDCDSWEKNGAKNIVKKKSQKATLDRLK